MLVPVSRWGTLVTIISLAGSAGGPWAVLASEVSGGIGSKTIDSNMASPIGYPIKNAAPACWQVHSRCPLKMF